MAEIKTVGIVIRRADYKDSDRILTLLTERSGATVVSARGCRRAKSPLLAASELFTYGEFVLFENKGRYTLSSCDVRESFYPLREDVDKLYAATYMLNLVNAAATEQENAAAQLKLLYYALSFTAYSQRSPVDMALCFSIKYLAALGFSPMLTACAVCGRDLRGDKRAGFDAYSGGAVCLAHAKGMEVSALSLEALRRMLLLSEEDMERVTLPEAVRNELTIAVNDYAEKTLERRFKGMAPG